MENNYGDLNSTKYCPFCGSKSIIQYPFKEIDNILECSKCGFEYKIEIISNE